MKKIKNLLIIVAIIFCLNDIVTLYATENQPPKNNAKDEYNNSLLKKDEKITIYTSDSIEIKEKEIENKDYLLIKNGEHDFIPVIQPYWIYIKTEVKDNITYHIYSEINSINKYENLPPRTVYETTIYNEANNIFLEAYIVDMKLGDNPKVNLINIEGEENINYMYVKTVKKGSLTIHMYATDSDISLYNKNNENKDISKEDIKKDIKEQDISEEKKTLENMKINEEIKNSFPKVGIQNNKYLKIYCTIIFTIILIINGLKKYKLAR